MGHMYAEEELGTHRLTIGQQAILTRKQCLCGAMHTSDSIFCRECGKHKGPPRRRQLRMPDHTTAE